MLHFHVPSVKTHHSQHTSGTAYSSVLWISLQDRLPGWEPLMLTDSSKQKKNKFKNRQFRDCAQCLLDNNMKNCICFTAGWIGMGGFPSLPPFSPVHFPASTKGTSNTTNCERLLCNLLFNFENNSLAVKERYALWVWRGSKNMPLIQKNGKCLFSESSYDIAKVLKICIPGCPLLGCYSNKLHPYSSQLPHYPRIWTRNTCAFSRLMKRFDSLFFKTYTSA